MAGPNLSVSTDSSGKIHYYNTPPGTSTPLEISKMSYDAAQQAVANTNLNKRDSVQQRQLLAKTLPQGPEEQKRIEDEKAAQALAIGNRDKFLQENSAPSGAGPAKLGTNVLNKYRSFNYNFTIASLTFDQFNNFANYKIENTDDLKYVVLSSKGKNRPEANNVVQDSENKVLNAPTSADITAFDAVLQSQRAAQAAAIADNNPKLAKAIGESINQIVIDQSKAVYAAQQAVEKETGTSYVPVTTSEVIQEYNKNSSGRFDMFIDDVEIKAVIASNQQTTTAIGYEINFTVIEPYSSFGFFEALQASALAAGYYSYLDCNFVLAVDFIGYKDDDTGGKPVPIIDPSVNQPAIRFFPITIFDVQTTITHEGTKYICKSVPSAYGAITEEETAKTSMSPEGSNVKAQLTDLMQKMTLAAKNAAIQIGNPNWDTYKVEFPTIAENGTVSENVDNEIAAYEFDPTFSTDSMKPQEIEQLAATDPRRLFVSPSDPSIPTKEKIEAIIFKSKYITDLIKASYDGGNIDSFVNAARQAKLFRVVLKKTVDKDKINWLTGRHSVIWTYQVIPTRTAYHRVPGQYNNITSIDDIKPLVLTKYDYIYTGLNTDVLDFKINLNFAYYSVINPTLGADQQPGSQQGDAATGNTNPKLPFSKAPTKAGLRAIPFAPWRSPPYVLEENPKAAPTPGDAILANVNIFHQNLMDSPTSLVEGEITILGDPYFLISGGSNNYILPNSIQGQYAGNGEAAALAGDVYVQLNFYNPGDIGAKGVIDKQLTGFSGIFQIIEVNNVFKNGAFTQVLQYVRVPTPIDDYIKSGSKVGLSSTVAPLNVRGDDSSPPAAHPATSSDGVVITPTSSENKPPQAPQDKTALYQGFTAGGNPISKATIDYANLAAGLKNPFAQVQAAVTDLQTTVNSAGNQITGAIRSAENQVTGAISAKVATVTGPLSNIIQKG